MSDTVKPALTAKEWEVWKDFGWTSQEYRDQAAYQALSNLMDDDAWLCSAENPRHPLAALALHGQSFGFTREDVEFLCGLHNELALASDYDAVRHIAARIEALLPPEDK